ncbi:MAG: amidohydrolase family protein, partial [Bacteroidota bacterium]
RRNVEPGTKTKKEMIVDSHVHFWKYDAVRDTWITDDMSVLRQNFYPKDAQVFFSPSKVKACVAVQADQSETETNFLIDLSSRHDFIKGVVGWVDFRKDDIGERLRHYSQFSVVKGFRHIVQSESQDFLLNKTFQSGINLLRAFDFTYDILIYHTQLRPAVSFAQKFPDQTFVLDHCAKPNIRNKEINSWKEMLKELAQHPHMFCKLSGLLTEANWKTWTNDDLKPYIDTVFETFGPGRIMFGSDWPVMMLAGQYVNWIEVVKSYITQYTAQEQENILSRNAATAYRLTL